jgi:hypothetical protein
LSNLTYIDVEQAAGSGNQVVLVEKDLEFPPKGYYRLHSPRAVAGPDDLAQALRDHYGAIIEQELRRFARTLTFRLSDEELASRLQAGIEQRMPALMDSYSGARQLVLFEVDRRPFLIKFEEPLPLPDGFQCELIPLVDIVEVEGRQALPEAEGEGTSGGEGGRTGRGRRGKAADGQGESAGQGDRFGRGQTATDGGGRGGFVIGETGANAGAGLFPVVADSETITIECKPLFGEPTISQLATGSSGLQAAVDDIAFRLQMPTCDRVGQFCVNAAKVIGGRALTISDFSTGQESFTRTRPAENGNLGIIDFTPIASPAIQLLRHLADVVSRLGALANRINAVYHLPENRGLIQGEWGPDPNSWGLHFFIELTDSLEPAVGYMFVVACRVILLQLLRSSREALWARIINFPIYARLFEQLVRTELADIDELMDLRRRLQEYIVRRQMEAAQGGQVLDWNAAVRGVTEALRTPAASGPAQTGPPYEVLFRAGEHVIRDAHNHLWSNMDLESAIATKRGVAESVDPLVKQLTDIPEVVLRLRVGVTSLRTELLNLLNELLEKNRQITFETEIDPMYGFLAGKIREDLPSADIPGTMFVLQGIHLQAHQQIGEFFNGSPWYAQGVNALFNARLGFESLKNFFTFTALIALSIVCPPAGFLFGVQLAAEDYAEAKDREALYQSLIDPELVITRAEVETELFAAKLGLALAFIPEAGEILSGLRYGARAVAKAGLEGGARILGRYVVRRITKSTVEALARASLQAFVKEVVTAYVLNALIERAMAPLLEAVQREATVTGSVGGLQGAAAVRRMLEQEKRADREERGQR